MLKLVPSQERDINSKSRGNALARKQRNSLPCTFRTSSQRSCNQRVGCLSGEWTIYIAIIRREVFFKVRERSRTRSDNKAPKGNHHQDR